MKRKFFAFMGVLIISCCIYGEDITLDNMLDILTQTSYRKEMYELQKEKTEALEKFYKLDEYNGVTASAEHSTTQTNKSIKQQDGLNLVTSILKEKEITILKMTLF